MASELQVNTITEATSGSGITFAKDIIPATPLSHRNMIINGAMQVAQRGTSFTSLTSAQYCLDRFKFNVHREQAIVDISRAADAPTGFKYSNKITITQAETTIDAGNYIQMEYALEANDISHLEYGTSNAKTLTLSFWVKSSSTGVFPITLSNSGGNYHYPSSYTINTANTWEYKTITIPGATAGSWTTTGPSEGFRFRIGLTHGSTYNGATANQWLSSASYANAFVTATNNVMTTTNATWQITGVQLELGSVATPFEHRSFSEELARCQRYYYVHGDGSIDADQNLGVGYGFSTSQLEHIVRFPVEMNHGPDLKQNSGTNYYQFYSNGDEVAVNFLSVYKSTRQSILLYKNSVTCTQGRAYRFHINHASAYLHFEAELGI